MGGAAYSKLGKTSSSNYATAWFSGSVVDAADYIANGSTLQAALNAACAASAVLLLPPGNVSAALTLPSSTTAYNFGIRGCGQNASILSGSLQIVSTAAITVTLENFTVSGGIVIDLNGGPGLAAGNTNGCIVNVDVTGTVSYASATHGFYLRNCGQFTIQNSGAWGAFGSATTSAYAYTLVGCSNLQMDNIGIYFYQRGLNIPAGPTGYHLSNLDIVACQYGIYCVFSVNQGIFVTNFIIDNGNVDPVNNQPYTTGGVGIYLQGPGSGINACVFTAGEVLWAFSGGVYSGAYCMQLYDMEHVMISNVDFTFADPSDSAIYLSNSTTNCHVTACAPPSGGYLCHAASGTSGTYCLNNIAGSTVLDSGSNHLSAS